MSNAYTYCIEVLYTSTRKYIHTLCSDVYEVLHAKVTGQGGSAKCCFHSFDVLEIYLLFFLVCVFVSVSVGGWVGGCVCERERWVRVCVREREKKMLGYDVVLAVTVA